MKIADWILTAENKKELQELKWLQMIAPDICGNCGKQYGNTLLGRLRQGCPECINKIKWQDCILQYWWPFDLCQKLRIHPEILAQSMAIALCWHKMALNRGKDESASGRT